MTNKTNLNISLTVSLLSLIMAVRAIGDTYTYVFIPDQSTVVASGGIAGVHYTYTIEGQFILTVNWDSNSASFDWVDTVIYHEGVPLDGNLDDLFDMTELVGTVVSDTEIDFDTADPMPGGKVVHLDLTLADDSVHLTGGFCELWPDGFCFDMNAVALKKFTTGQVSWIPGESGPADWSIEPNTPTTCDVISFSGPTAVFGNDCEAERSVGGTPTLTVDPVNRTVELWFQPPPPDFCPQDYSPVCGFEGSFDPLEAGQWLFFGNDPNAAFSIPFQVVSVYYVDAADGNDNNDGLSPETAFATIQKGIDSTVDGDTVIAHAGIYEENINFLGKNITLTSADPTNPDVVAATIIQGTVVFRGTEDLNCVLAGFDINGQIGGFDHSMDPNGENHTNATIAHCILQGNGTCGGTVIEACDGTVSDCLIADNTTICLCLFPVVRRCHGLIKNCTIASNNSGVAVGEGGSTTLQNCIIYHNFDHYWAQVSIGSGGTLNISYCDVQGGLGGLYLEDSNCVVNWGPGNIDTDPCFVSVGYWNDQAQQLVEGDYHLRWDSPCINAGDPCYAAGENERDIDGEPRIMAGRIDMGVDEVGEKQADFTRDGIINFKDFAILGRCWWSCPTEANWYVLCDLYKDEQIDILDLVEYANDWLWQASWYGDTPEPEMVWYVDPNCAAGSVQEQGQPTTFQEPEELRFTVTVEGSYIHFEDMIHANCCPGRLWLEMTVEDYQITIYEFEEMEGCFCMCDFPTTATLGPFAEGDYLLEVIDVYGNSLGSVSVTIPGPE